MTVANKSKTKNLDVPDEKALAVLNDEEKRLIGVLADGFNKLEKFPCFKDKQLTMKELPGTVGEAVAMGIILEICKTDHIDAALKIINSPTAVRTSDDPDECMNMALQQIAALKPQSYLEAMLTSQMIQVNAAVVKCMGLAFMEGQTFAGKEMNANLAIKLQRVFVAQAEALQKLRGKGQQTMRIEHVHVNAGGQAAIVGHVEHSGRGEGE
jgi:hypothetical protein